MRAEVVPELRAGLLALLAAGAPLPRVGVDVGDPVIASLELAWEDAKVGLGVDLARDELDGLEKHGWRVVGADSGELGWARRATEALRDELALPEVDDDGDDALSSSDGDDEGDTDG